MSKVVHFEIPADDGDRAVAFYRNVLGWEMTRFGEERYWLVRAGADDEPGANGALVDRDALHAAPVVIAGVTDIDDALQRAADNGGQVVQGRMPVPGVGWSAYVRDTEGNTVGFFQTDAAAGQS